MQRVSHPTAVGTRPAPRAVTAPGYFGSGDPMTGTPATVLDRDFLNQVQEELMGVVEAAGVSPSKTDNTQLLAALRILFGVQPGLGYYLTGSVIPAGMRVVKADGALLNRTGLYAPLYAYAVASGNMAANQGVYDADPGHYGPGNGTTTFQLPTVEDFIRSTSSGRGVGTVQEDAFQGFSIYFPGHPNSGGENQNVSTNCNTNVDLAKSALVNDFRDDGTNGTPRIANETRPKNIAYPFVITY